MRNRLAVIAVSTGLLLFPGCSKQIVKTTIPYTWVISIRMDPNVPGQCLQESTPPGGNLQAYPTYVPVHEGDYIVWRSSYQVGNVVYFPNGGLAGFPGTPMFSKSAGNWVRAFPSGNSLGTTATLTQEERTAGGGSGFNFQYSRVVVLDPNTNQPTSCQAPDPVQGIGIHVDN